MAGTRKSRFAVTGARVVGETLKVMATRFPRFAAKALNEEALDTLRDAKALTPREKGPLRDTAKVYPMATPNNLEADVLFNRTYALAVHEIQARHSIADGFQGGQWKYLSTAQNARAPKFTRRIAGKIGSMVRKRNRQRASREA